MRRLWMTVLFCACGADPAAQRGLVRVATSPEATATGAITGVSVTVSPAGASANLTQGSPGTFSGNVAVPLGNQTVTATAVAGSTTVATGSATVTVTGGGTTPVAIKLLDATGRTPGPDHSPVITSLQASATRVNAGDQVTLSASAVEPDGDPIAFAWTQSPGACGTFAAPASANTTWTAAAGGNCTLTLAATARGRSDSRSATVQVGSSAPTLVQHLASTSNSPFLALNGNDYRFTLPNPVQAGNCLVFGMTYQKFQGTTPTLTSISDSAGNVWPTVPAATTSNGLATSSIFVLPNAKPGVTTITVSFADVTNSFQYTVSEFNNIDRVSPVAASNGLADPNQAPNISAGTLNPADNDAGGGNLIWSYFIDNGDVGWNTPLRFTPGPQFALLDADIGWFGNVGLSHASQYFVQTNHAPVTATMTAPFAADVDPESYNGVAVALRVAPAGSPAPTGNIRINQISLFTNTIPPNEWDFQFPTHGNLIVGIVCQQGIIDIQSITDTQGNTWQSFRPELDEPQIWYAVNARPDPNLRITVQSSGVPVNSSFIFYDISGADGSPPDAFADDTGDGINHGSNRIDDAPVITPRSLGLTLTAISFGTGPAMGFSPASPAGAFFDYVYYTGEIDDDRMDNADGRGHLYNTDLSSERFGYVLNHTDGTTASATAVHFRSAGR